MSNPGKEARKAAYGWFTLANKPGDRTLEQQLTGLDPLWLKVVDRTVLDIGCAEGLIAIECCKRGAAFARGVEIVPVHVQLAKSLRNGMPCAFEVADAQTWVPDKLYDVVLLLAVLHKLPDPTSACVQLARVAKELCVIRFPATSRWPVIVDARSGNEPHDIGEVMESLGFTLECVTNGPTDVAAGPDPEQTYFYVR